MRTGQTAILALALGAMLGAVGCSRANADVRPSRAEAARPVKLAAVERGDVERPIRGAGLSRARHQADLAFKVGGVVASVSVEEGTRVKKGQVLARIDPTEISAGAAQARRGAEQAERDLARARTLATAATLPGARLESIETNAAMARSAATMATFNERHTVLVAPSDGFVERRLVEAGEVVAPGRPAIRFVGTERGFSVTVAVSDRDALRVHEGDPARVVFDAAPTTPIDAKVGDVARIGNPRTGTFDVEVVLPEGGPVDVRSGLVAKVEIARREPAPAHVPFAALCDVEGERAAVYAIEDGKAKRIPVEIGFLFGDRVALRADLPGVDRVVVAGQHDLASGTPAREAATSPAGTP